MGGKLSSQIGRCQRKRNDSLFPYLKITCPGRSYGASHTRLTAFFGLASVWVTAEHSFNSCIPFPVTKDPMGVWFSASSAWTRNPLKFAPRSLWIISTVKWIGLRRGRVKKEWRQVINSQFMVSLVKKRIRYVNLISFSSSSVFHLTRNFLSRSVMSSIRNHSKWCILNRHRWYTMSTFWAERVACFCWSSRWKACGKRE